MKFTLKRFEFFAWPVGRRNGWGSNNCSSKGSGCSAGNSGTGIMISAAGARLRITIKSIKFTLKWFEFFITPWTSWRNRCSRGQSGSENRRVARCCAESWISGGRSSWRGKSWFGGGNNCDRGGRWWNGGGSWNGCGSGSRWFFGFYSDMSWYRGWQITSPKS